MDVRAMQHEVILARIQARAALNKGKMDKFYEAKNKADADETKLNKYRNKHNIDIRA